MAEKFVSPGVFTRENDLSFLPEGVAEIGTAVVGAFPKGPAFEPTIINNIEEFRERFGGESEKFYATYAVKNILQNASTVTVVRVGELGGYSHTGAVLTGFGTGSNGEVTSSVFLAPSDSEDTITVTAVSASGGADVAFELSSSAGTTSYTASFQPTDSNYFTKLFGTDPLGKKDVYVFADFETTNEDIATLNSASVEADQFDFEQDVVHASTPWVTNRQGDADLFRFHTLNDGTDTNRDVKVSIQNVKLNSELNTDFGRFDVVVRRFSDTDSRIEVLETFAGCNLDPTSPNYIARRIGDQFTTVDGDDRLVPNGEYPNNSSYIRVEMTDNPEALPESTVPAGFGSYSTPLNIATGSGVQDIPLLLTASVVVDSETAHLGINFDGSKDWEAYIAPVSDTALTSSVGESNTFTLPPFVFSDSTSTFQKYRRFTLGFQGGFTGGNPNEVRRVGADVEDSNVLGFDLTTPTSSGSVAYKRALDLIQSPLDYDYNLLLTPGVSRDYGTSVVGRALEIVEDRGDAFYIADLNWIDESINSAVSAASQYDSSYMATYYPWVKIVDSTSTKPIWVPPSVVMGGVFAFSDSISSEWFAPAGLNRGGINGARDIYKRLYRADMDTLYESKVNPIVSYPGQGIVAWGQKTLQDRASSLDRINVRRLLINLKKFIASTSRFLVFDQNTNETRNRFLNLVEPYLDQVQQQQGLFAYRVDVSDDVNTAEVIDRNQLIGKIYIQPVKAAEFIVLDFNVMPTGAEFPQ